jgi:hypothetical protein
VCNGVDDDCDGEVDEGCDTGDPGGWSTGDPDAAASASVSATGNTPPAHTKMLALPDQDGDGRAVLVMSRPGSSQGGGVWGLQSDPGDALSTSDAAWTLGAEDEDARLGEALLHVPSELCGTGGALAVGAPRAGTGSVAGPNPPGAIWLLPLDGIVDATLDDGVEGEQVNGLFGTALAWIRADEDGFLAIGSPGLGDGGGAVLLHRPCAGAAPTPVVLLSSETGERAAASLADVDLDGDGIDELVLGAPDADPDGAADAGRARPGCSRGWGCPPPGPSTRWRRRPCRSGASTPVPDPASPPGTPMATAPSTWWRPPAQSASTPARAEAGVFVLAGPVQAGAYAALDHGAGWRLDRDGLEPGASLSVGAGGVLFLGSRAPTDAGVVVWALDGL